MKNIKWKYILYILNMIFYQHCYYDFGCMACENGVSFLIFESFFAACLGFPTGHFGCSSGWKKSLTNTRIGIIFHETDHLGHELRRMEKVFSWPYDMALRRCRQRPWPSRDYVLPIHHFLTLPLEREGHANKLFEGHKDIKHLHFGYANFEMTKWQIVIFESVIQEIMHNIIEYWKFNINDALERFLGAWRR